MDPITQEVVRYRLSAIADEMETSLLRAAYSNIVKEGLDASAALFDTRGQNLAQAAAIPIHLGCMIPAVETILDRWPVERMRDGDVYVLNDPYAGGTHLPDIAIVRPLFVAGQPLGVAATMSHHQEIGGMVPGSLPPNATDVYQEGLRLPPLKLVDAGEPVTQVFDILRANVRTPDVVLGDLRAQLSAVHLASRRMNELAEAHSTTELTQIATALLDQSETLTRARITEIPDGRYEFIDYLDDDGIDVGRQISIRATLLVAGSEITVDFTGSSEQVRGPFNCVPASSIAAVYFVVRAITGADIPNNSGCYRPIRVVLPEGSIVNASPPAPVNSRTATVRRLCDVLLGCFAQAVPDRVPAASCGQLLVMNFGGVDPRSGRFYVTSELGVGGMGGRPGLDGVDAVETDATNCMNVPAEAIEMDSPLRVLSWSIQPDSAGAGQWRGGCGTEKVFELTVGEATVNYRGERHTASPWGVRGGLPAPSSGATLHKTSGEDEALPSKTMVRLSAGDRLRVQICGGGGYGDPFERPISAVVEDVRDHRISAAAARKLYGVVIQDNTVDWDGTEVLRKRASDAGATGRGLT